MTDLKPCPLCGSEAHIFNWHDSRPDDECPWIGCGNLACGIQLSEPIVEVLIARWNALPRKEEEKAK